MGIPPGAIMALSGEVLSPENRSTGFGIFYTVFYVGLASFPPIAGLILDLMGAAIAPVLFAGILTMLAVLPLPVFRLLQHRWAPEGQSVAGKVL